MKGPLLLGALAVLSGTCAVLALSCSSTTNTRIGIDAPPFTDQSFGPLGDYLDHRCGSLDCHGQPGRNLRIWGCEGMRLDAGMIPVCNRTVPGGGRTTVEEHQATAAKRRGHTEAVRSVTEEKERRLPVFLDVFPVHDRQGYLDAVARGGPLA